MTDTTQAYGAPTSPTKAELALPFFGETRPSASLAYIAAPYSDPDPCVVAARMGAFDKAIARLLTESMTFPVSPLLNHGIVGRHKVPGNWEFWQHYSRRLLSRCDELLVIDLPGWESSEGVQGEIEFAHSIHLPVRFYPYDPEAYNDAHDRALADEAGVAFSIAREAMTKAQGDIGAARADLKSRWGTYRDDPASA